MDIDHPVPVLFDHLRRDHHKEPGQHDQIRLVTVYCLHKLPVEDFPGLIIFGGYAAARDPVLLRSFQRVGIPVIADHACDLCVRDLPVSHPVDDRLEICPAAGDHHHYL